MVAGSHCPPVARSADYCQSVNMRLPRRLGLPMFEVGSDSLFCDFHVACVVGFLEFPGSPLHFVRACRSADANSDGAAIIPCGTVR